MLLGTLYPLLLDALGLGKISVGPPYFEAVFVPLMAPALFLMGIGPLARWKPAQLGDLARRLRWAAGVQCRQCAGRAVRAGPLDADDRASACCWACWIVASTAVLNLVQRAARPRRRRRCGSACAAQPRSYYGMLLAHFGVAVFVIGVTMVNGLRGREATCAWTPGDSTEIAGYAFRFDGVREVQRPELQRRAAARSSVTRDGAAGGHAAPGEAHLPRAAACR